MAPNLQRPFKIDLTDMHTLFGSLSYPYNPIRNDAITAVGAPSSIGFLMRAIYWLYQVVKVYFLQKRLQDDSHEGDIREL